MAKLRVSRPGLLLAILQVLFALLSLICLGSLSSTQCWHHEPPVRGYLWWLTAATLLVGAGAYFLEADEAEKYVITVIEAIATIFWLAGAVTAGDLNSLAAQLPNCHGKHKSYPETSAVLTFAVFEMLLFAAGTYHAWFGIPWPHSRDENVDVEIENSSSTIGPTGQITHLKTGDFNEYINVHVGSDDKQRDFPVPKAPICRRSTFVRTATSGMWNTRLGLSSKAKEVDLSDDDPEAFETYLQCITSPNTVTVKGSDAQHPSRAQTNSVFVKLINAYFLAEKLDDPESMNLIIDEIARYCLATHRVPDRETVAYVYENSVGTSLLRLLLVDMYHLGYDREGIREERLEGMPNEFLVQFSRADPDIQTVAPGSQRYHVVTEKPQRYRNFFQRNSRSHSV